MAANLQGIWNDSLAPPWESKYTININTQMNYWPAEVTNLSELHEPLFDLIDRGKRGRPPRREGAVRRRRLRAAPQHRSLGPRRADRQAGSGIWPMGAAWLSLHLWDHYDFTRDRDVPRERAYPAMKEAGAVPARLHGRRTRRDGSSPGRRSRPRTATSCRTAPARGCAWARTMDTQIAHALFTRLIEASEILGVERRRSGSGWRRRAPSCRRCRSASTARSRSGSRTTTSRIPGTGTSRTSSRCSPGNQITPRGTPELAQAARATLERRLANGGGHTGWSRAWIINFWARLEDARQGLREPRRAAREVDAAEPARQPPAVPDRRQLRRHGRHRRDAAAEPRRRDRAAAGAAVGAAGRQRDRPSGARRRRRRYHLEETARRRVSSCVRASTASETIRPPKGQQIAGLPAAADGTVKLMLRAGRDQILDLR